MYITKDDLGIVRVWKEQPVKRLIRDNKYIWSGYRESGTDVTSKLTQQEIDGLTTNYALSVLF